MSLTAHREHPTFSVVLLSNIILIFFRHLLAMADSASTRYPLATMADSAGIMYALATVLSVLAIVAVLLRFYARRMKQTALSWDDYAILPALVRHLQILHIYSHSGRADIQAAVHDWHRDMHGRRQVLRFLDRICCSSDEGPQGQRLVTLDNIRKSEKTNAMDYFRFLTIA